MGTQDACPKSASQGLCIACNADFWFGACSDYLGTRVSMCTHGAVTYAVYLCINGVCAGAVVTKSNVHLKQPLLTVLPQQAGRSGLSKDGSSGSVAGTLHQGLLSFWYFADQLSWALDSCFVLSGVSLFSSDWH